MAKKTVIDIVKLAVSILTCQLAGILGGLFTAPNIATWYAYLNKPAFNPPNWVFSPVWISLYLLMGIAVWLVWRQGMGAKGVKSAVILFVVQLIVNPVWSFAFFGLHSPLYGLIVIIVLWVLILLTITRFFKVSKTAGVLMLPYILWVSFATVLNGALFALN